MFTTVRPLAFFLERIALFAAMRKIILDVNHIPAELSQQSDALSRPEERAHPPDCLPNEQLRISVSDVWQPMSRIRVAPPGSRFGKSVPVECLIKPRMAFGSLGRRFASRLRWEHPLPLPDLVDGYASTCVPSLCVPDLA